VSIPVTNAPQAQRLAYSIKEFCALVGVSRNYFYTLPDAEKPLVVQRGGRRLIPADAARAWLQPNVAA
jgi:hypothetical protein